MHSIFLVGKHPEIDPADRLESVLERFGGVVRLGESVKVPVGSAEFLLMELSKPAELTMPAGILIFCGQPARMSSMQIPEGFSAVVQSENEHALRFLKKTNRPAITCGMSFRDTLSLSSLKEQSASISLQRDLVRLDGKTVEAREIPVKLTKPADPYLLLASAAVVLLCCDVQDEMVV